MMIDFSIDDIDGKVAYEAFAHSNSSPLELAQRIKGEYVKDMASLISELEQYANEDNRQDIQADLLAHKMAYINKLHSWLRSRTTFVSPFIAGRSKFNHKQMTNRARSSDKSGANLSEWEKLARLTLITKYKLAKPIEIPTLADLQARLKKLQDNRKFMQSVNKIMKSGLSHAEKTAKLSTVGVSQPKIDEMIKANFYFIIADLDSNQAKINQLKKKIKGGLYE